MSETKVIVIPETSDIKPGVRVRYAVGKGYGEGRVANVVDGMATIATEGGKLVNRKASRLTIVLHSENDGKPKGEDLAV